MAGIPNPLSNSRELLRNSTIVNKIVDSLEKNKSAGQIVEGIKGAANVVQKGFDRLENRLSQSDFNTQMYGTRLRPDQREYVQEQRKQAIDDIRFADNPLKEAGKKLKENFNPANIGSDILGNTVYTKQAQLTTNKYTNPHRMAGDIGVQASQNAGLDSNLSRAAVAAGVPLLYATLSGQIGSPLDGFRPKGYKAVAPVSKDEDPTGKTPRNILEEGALRTYFFQRSQMLPFKEFIKERPDVMPSTIADYRRYVNLKPQAGNRIDIDRDKKTFTAFGGLVKGTARGLNDPEIRVKGIPVSASSVLGAAAGYGTILAGKRFLDPKGLGIEREVDRPASDIRPDISGGVGMKTHAEVKERFDRAGQTMPQGPLQNIPENRREQGVPKDVGKTIYIGTSGRREQDRFGTPSFFGPRKAGENVTPRVPAAKIGRRIRDLKEAKKEYQREASEAARKVEQLNIPGLGDSRTTSQFKTDAARAVQQEIDETVKQARNYGKPLLDKDGNPIPGTAKLNIAGQKFQEFFAERPGLKEPAIIAGGLLAAAGTAAVAKKLFKKAEQERIKKEDPLHYKKYKRGDYTE